MSKGKWGESFLKSGLPLEHLTLAKLRSIGWDCQSGIEYTRLNRENEETWFELDIAATSQEGNGDTDLSLLIECKYHDQSRFWFFLPSEPHRYHFDEHVLNTGPLATLHYTHAVEFLNLAPLSIGGMVVSEDGTRQDNSVYTAIQQLANGFVPYCMQVFSYNLDYHNYIGDIDEFKPAFTAIIPMIVTNANIYRLRPDVTDLEEIRQATTPNDIAEEVKWTWCYHETSRALIAQNAAAINEAKETDAPYFYRFPSVQDRLYDFISRPSWIAIVNIKALEETVSVLYKTFVNTKLYSAEDLLRGKRSRKRKVSRKVP